MNLKRMDSYKRVVDFLKECPNNLIHYPELKEDLKVLCTPDLKQNIRADLSHIVPGLLILATSEDDDIAQELIPVYSIISNIASNEISIKTKSWWKEMESNIVPNKFSSGIRALIEKNSDKWAHTWIFAVTLMISDSEVQGSTVNALLKIMELAFKKSLPDHTSISEKAFICWIKFIEIFASNPRILHTKKLVGLLIRPLTIPMGPKSCIKIIEAFKTLFEKVGKTEDKDVVLDIINPFLEYSYRKYQKSFSVSYPDECCKVLLYLINGKEITRKHYILPILSWYSFYVESQPSEDLLLNLWARILDGSDVVDIKDYESYLEEIMAQYQKIMKNSEILNKYEKLKEYLINNQLPSLLPEILDKLLISDALSPKILADMMEFNNFRTKTLTNYFKNISCDTDKRDVPNAGRMEAWDTFCAAFTLFINSKTYHFQETDYSTYKSLILFPLQTHAKWAGVTQRTWHSIIDSLDKIGILKDIIPDIISTLNLNIDNNKINIACVLDIIGHLFAVDKKVAITATVDRILVRLPKDDPKNAIELLAFIENLIGHGDKKQYLSAVLSELLRICTCYDQLFEHRIKTKVSKLHRKLIVDSKYDKSEKNKDKTPSPIIRSPLMSTSNFLHRLAKSEEKKGKSSLSPIIKDRTKRTSLDSNKEINESNIICSEKNASSDLIKDENVTIKEEKAALPKSENVAVANEDAKNDIKSKVDVQDQVFTNRNLQNGDSCINSDAVLTKATSDNKKKIPLSYFDDDSEEFVVVPFKPKLNVPLTEHQKEKLLERKSDIPALYQDLSQDTQSMSSTFIKSDILRTTSFDDVKPRVQIITPELQEKHDVSKDSDVIDVTPPSVNHITLSTPIKSSPLLSASKKLNFEGLVKAGSPISNEKDKNSKNTPEEEISPSISRRILRRRSTSKYSNKRMKTKVSDSSNSSVITSETSQSQNSESTENSNIKQIVSNNELNINVSNEGEKNSHILVEECDNIKSFVVFNELKSNLSVETADQITNTKDYLDPLQGDVGKTKVNNSTDITSVPKEDIISKGDNSLINENTFRDESENREELPFVQNGTSEIIYNGKIEEIENKKTTNTSSLEELPKHPELGTDLEKESVESLKKSDLSSGKEQNEVLKMSESSSDRQANEKIKNSEIFSETPIAEKDQSQKSPQQNKCQNALLTSDTKGDSDNLNLPPSEVTELSGSLNNKCERTPPTSSQRSNRRPRKRPPTPYSPKLTRSRKLSLQNKDKSPKSPKVRSVKVRAPKPNTEFFSSDSNDSLNGIIPLERVPKNVDLMEVQMILNKTPKSLTFIEEIGKEEILDGHNRTEPEKNNEYLKNEDNMDTLKNSVVCCNENKGRKRGRKRKIIASATEEGNLKIDSSDNKAASFIKKTRRKKSLVSRGNSASPKLTPMEHWLFKKEKTSFAEEPTDVGDGKKSLEENIVTITENMNTSSSPIENRCSLSENFSHVLKENSIPNSSNSGSQIESKELKKTEALEISNEEVSNDKDGRVDEDVTIPELKSNELAELTDDIVLSSQSLEKSESMFSSVSKKAKKSEISLSMMDEIKEREDVSEDSSAETKIEKLASEVKTYDLIFKDAKVEEKITIFMGHSSPPSENPLVSMLDNNEENAKILAKTEEVNLISEESLKKYETEASLDVPQELNELQTSFIEKKENVTFDEASLMAKSDALFNGENSTSIPFSLALDLDSVQTSNVCNETFLDSNKVVENLQQTTPVLDLIERSLVLIEGSVREPCEEPNVDETCSCPEDEFTEHNNLNAHSEIILESVNDAEEKISPETNQSLIPVTDENETSENLFKVDTPKKRGARFIHTTEKEEDGGDTVEERRRRNFRPRRNNVDDINNLVSGGRSKHMLQLAQQQDRSSRVNTSRKRPSIVPITFGSNWPTGPSEDWIGIRPSTPAACTSPGILKPSPISVTASTSPPPKKKRVNFLDPPVSTGLLYEKGRKVGVGQLHYAEVSPGEDTVWKRDEEETENKSKDNIAEVEWHDQDTLEAAEFEVEVLSSDEPLEVLTVSNNEICQDISIDYPRIIDISTNILDDGSTEKQDSISENISRPSQMSNSTCDARVQTESTSEYLELGTSNKQSEQSVPSVEQLLHLINSDQFIGNLGSAVNLSNTNVVVWLGRLISSLTTSLAGETAK